MSSESPTFSSVFADLCKESDRGCVLIACEFIHDRLEELLRNGLNGSDPKAMAMIAENLSGENQNSLLGRFWAKQVLAFMMGLIDRDTYDALQALRKMRIEAAHSSKSMFLKPADGRLDNLIRKAGIKNLDSSLSLVESWFDQSLVWLKNAGLANDWCIQNLKNETGITSKSKFRFIIAIACLDATLSYSVDRLSRSKSASAQALTIATDWPSSQKAKGDAAGTRLISPPVPDAPGGPTP